MEQLELLAKRFPIFEILNAGNGTDNDKFVFGNQKLTKSDISNDKIQITPSPPYYRLLVATMYPVLLSELLGPSQCTFQAVDC